MKRRWAALLGALAATAASAESDTGRLFEALRARDAATAAPLVDALPATPLATVARAELYLAAPPAPEIAAAFVAANPDLPESPALARAAGVRAVLPYPRALVRPPAPSKRAAPQAGRDPAGAALAAQLRPILKANDGLAAETLVEAAAAALAPDALTELRARTAWAYFLGGDDAGAIRVATLAHNGAGDWAAQADWTAGLAAWRARDFAGASAAFQWVADRARDAETIAAGLFWAARADTVAGRADAAAPRLRTAARYAETFYGLLAAEALGQAAPLAPPVRADLARLRPNVRAAAALADAGEPALADVLLRHQARIGPAAEHSALVQIAGELGLTATQAWLAGNVPADGANASRYPQPVWAPSGGWRVDSALLYAHALQESRLRPDAVSPAGARGLMQLMPGTARLVARAKGEAFQSGANTLDNPSVSFEYGQSYLEQLAADAGTGGLLPKVIAAYNAGPNNVALWNLRPMVQADPLLFIEAIPFAETRAYVAIVLRNYWMYQRQQGAATPSLAALARGQWPRFPATAPLRQASWGGGVTAANR